MKLPFWIALTGLSTSFCSRAPRTSLMPCGAFALTSVICSANVVGKKVLIVTANKAAATVPARYINTIGRNCDVWLARRFAIAEATDGYLQDQATCHHAVEK